MPRDATTAIYTRLSNSFSQPVVGTTISPTDADSFFDDVESSMNSFIGTSTTSVAVGTGSKSFTTQASKSLLPGLFVQIFDEAAPTTNYMFGSVTSYNSTTGDLVVNVTDTAGSGTYTDWLIVQAGAKGSTGSTGSTGATGAGYGGTSSTSLLIASSTTKTFTTQAGLAYQVGTYMRASSMANGANFMEGLCSAYSATTLSIAVSKIGGSGTFADWGFAVAGAPGAGDLLSTNNLSDLANTATALSNLGVTAQVARANSISHLFLG